MDTIQKLPKWFDGILYSDGANVTNRLSGESYELNNVELSMYDFIMGCVMLGSTHKDLRKGLDWFRKNNAKAYMVLLD
jgi:hypothetical protein